jgi:LacI family transcriptional regulator, gluconate utilization system Gnt-I transcriptional repressor
MTGESATLADVARLAGVSVITVSRVVRNLGPISESTRQRVNEAILTLDYVPNRAAGMLASAGSNLVAVLLPSLSNIVFPEVMRGIAEGLRGTGHQPLIGVTDYDSEQEEALLTSFMAWRPVAVITTGFEHTANTRRILSTGKIRVAELMDIDSQPIDLAVGLSHRRAGRVTAKHLVDLGYRRIGYAGHDWTSDRRARLRYEGLVDGLAARGLSIVAETLSPGPSSTEAGKTALATLLAKGASPDVVAFSNDDMAVGGYFHCLASGIEVKHDLALFGFNGLEIGQSMPAPLSTLRSNRFLIGKKAVEILLSSSNRAAAGQIVDTGFEIVPGQTA